MSMNCAAHGRLGRDPKDIQIASGKSMAVASVAVSLPCREAQDGFETFWLKLVAFGREADALLKLQKGDPVSVSGRIHLSHWTRQDGTKQQDVELIADSIVAARA